MKDSIPSRNALACLLALALQGTACAPNSNERETDAPSDTEDAQDDMQPLVAAFGGREALEGFEGFAFREVGRRWLEDEAQTPEDVTSASAFTREVHLRSGSEPDQLRVDYTRTLEFLLFDGIEQEFQLVLDGDIGSISDGESALGFPGGPLSSDRVASTWREVELLNPVVLVRRALARDATVVEVTRDDVDPDAFLLLELSHPVAPIAVWLDRASGEIRRLQTLSTSHLRRDVDVVVTFDDWSNTADPQRFPASVEMWVEGLQVLELERSTVDATRPEGFFDGPADGETASSEDAQRGAHAHHFHESFAAIGLPQDGVATALEATELAPGITFLNAGTYNQMVVEQEGGLVVVDAPLHPERAALTLRWLEERYPNKSLRHLVVSHFHQDHAGGVRSFAAEGATVVVGPGLDDFWNDTVFGAASSVRPDALSERSDPTVTVSTIETVGGTRRLDDPQRPVSVQHLTAQEHAVDMVLATAEHDGQRFVFVADLYVPGLGTIVPGGIEGFFQGLRAHDIIDASCEAPLPTTIVGAHGGFESFESTLAFADAQGIEREALGCS